MRSHPLALALAALLAASVSACAQKPAVQPGAPPAAAAVAPADSYASAHLGDYVSVPLKADLSAFDARDREMIGLLVQASMLTDDLYWQQSWKDGASLLETLPDADTRRLAALSFGPWDRLNNDTPFVAGVGARPPGSTFYPADMTKDEFEKASLPDKTSWYTLLRRDANGKLVTVPYHQAYRPVLEKIAALLREAAPLSKDAQFGNYLRMRADALLSDDFQRSDMAWMDMKSNPVDIVIGPIETYEDQLFGYKASYEGLVLIKDIAWSERLARFAAFLPELQRGLPVPAKYKAEKPGSSGDLNAYNAIYYGGNANVGAKTIAINLPNDEQVQLKKGTRRLQLENVMQAKFDHILMPIAKMLIAQDQLGHVTFDAFFEDTMFHEVAHGLGIKNTLDGKGTVTQALKEYASNFEEGKADVLGLYLITALSEKGELDKTRLMDSYVTFLAGILRAVRFGAGDAHGKANMIRFHFFEKAGAFSRDPASGRYRVQFDKMKAAMNALSEKLLTVQGDGDYQEAKRMTDEMGVISPELASDLKRLGSAKIPVDVSFEQGLSVLGLAAPASPTASAVAANGNGLHRVRGNAIMGKDGYGITLCDESTQRMAGVSGQAKPVLDKFLAGGAHEFFIDGWAGPGAGTGIDVQRIERVYTEGPGCKGAPDNAILVARGNEPFWSLTFGADGVKFEQPGQPSVVVRSAAFTTSGNERRLDAKTATGELHVVITPGACSDGMSDAIHGSIAKVTLGEHPFAGCAYAGSAAP